MRTQHRQPRRAHEPGHRVRRHPGYLDEGTFSRSEIMSSRLRPQTRIRVVHHQPAPPTPLGG
jgi:hypothetical protein